MTRGARWLRVGLFAVVALGPGCTGSDDDGDGSGGLGGAGTGGATSGGSMGSGATPSSTGGSDGSTDGGGEAGSDVAGGAGGIGGDGSGGANTGGTGGTGSGIPDEVLDLGEYSAGESLPWVPSNEPLPVGESDFFRLTFLDVVWFGGELTTTGTGTPELTLYDGDEVATFTGSWEDHLLPAGVYYLCIAPQGSTPLDEGYGLDILTRSPVDAGTVDPTTSVNSTGVFDLAGQFRLIKFVAAAPTVLSGTVELTSGNVDVFVYDNSADIVASYESTSDTEPVAPLKLPAGTYMIQMVSISATADYMAAFEWDDP